MPNPETRNPKPETRTPIPRSAFDDRLTSLRAAVSQALETCLTPPVEKGSRPTYPLRLWEAMSYSVMAGGKRVRPILVLLAYEAVGDLRPAASGLTPAGRRRRALGGLPCDLRPATCDLSLALPAACAAELAHTASLIHDDLPAMDNDDLRRGRPTCHRAFDVATALLAGDGLEALAFEVLARSPAPPQVIVQQVRELALAIGPRGMAVGQAADMSAECRMSSVECQVKRDPLHSTLEYIHLHKTASLMRACARMGGLAAGADERCLNALGLYGERLGLAFQVVDDVLDATAGSAALGKRTAKDAAARKLTYPAVMGVEAARAEAARRTAQAVDALLPLGEAARALADLAERLLERAS